MNKVKITKTCPFCWQTFTKEFDRDIFEVGIRARESGALIQNAFPTLTPDEREFLMTGICNSCWNNM